MTRTPKPPRNCATLAAEAVRRVRLGVVASALCGLLGGADTLARDEVALAWAGDALDALDAHDRAVGEVAL